MVLTLEESTVNEGKTFFYQTVLTDEDNVPITLAAIVSATLTLCDAETLTIINGRDKQDILNLNNVTIEPTSGILQWEVQPEDNILVTEVTAGELESHIALFSTTYDTDKIIIHEREILVRQIAKLP